MRSGPTAMIIKEESTVSVIVFPTVLESRSFCCAPKYWATITVAPMVIPIKRTSRRLRIGPLAPTAAKAVSPTYFPTTMESTVL